MNDDYANYSTDDWLAACTDLARRQHADFGGAVVTEKVTLPDGTVLVWNADADRMEVAA